ncbi:MAG TPA: SRPBCC domain-containing protein [Bacteroidetes bacterium]|nr:SRPBCC domain-containing protein [Bacteroidota bacterium]
MKKLNTQIEINAPDYEVWMILNQFYAYELWNPFISEVDGDLKVGNKIKVTLSLGMNRINKRIAANNKANPTKESELFLPEDDIVNKSSSFKVKITHFDENKRLSWERKSFFLGTYAHDFILEQKSDNQTIFHNNIQMSGFLVSIGWNSSIKKIYRSGLELMNEALKRKIESDEFYVDEKLLTR